MLSDLRYVVTSSSPFPTIFHPLPHCPSNALFLAIPLRKQQIANAVRVSVSAISAEERTKTTSRAKTRLLEVSHRAHFRPLRHCHGIRLSWKFLRKPATTLHILGVPVLCLASPGQKAKSNLLVDYPILHRRMPEPTDRAFLLLSTNISSYPCARALWRLTLCSSSYLCCFCRYSAHVCALCLTMNSSIENRDALPHPSTDGTVQKRRPVSRTTTKHPNHATMSQRDIAVEDFADWSDGAEVSGSHLSFPSHLTFAISHTRSPSAPNVSRTARQSMSFSLWP